MQVFFIEQLLKNSFFDKFLKKINIQGDKITLNYNVKKMKLKRKTKLIKKLVGILEENTCNTVILSKDLKQDLEFKKLLQSCDITIINGRYLHKVLIEKIINRLILQNKFEKNKIKFAIAVNDKNAWNTRLIKNLAVQFKNTNIVTNNINSFKKVEHELFEEDGIMITVTNNKKKSLARADVILNLDFPEEFLNKYRIFDYSIIINLEENVRIYKKRFCGQIINDYEIKLKPETEISKMLEREQYKNYELKELAECYIMNNPKDIKNIIICK